MFSLSSLQCLQSRHTSWAPWRRQPFLRCATSTLNRSSPEWRRAESNPRHLPERESGTNSPRCRIWSAASRRTGSASQFCGKAGGTLCFCWGFCTIKLQPAPLVRFIQQSGPTASVIIYRFCSTGLLYVTPRLLQQSDLPLVKERTGKRFWRFVLRSGRVWILSSDWLIFLQMRAGGVGISLCLTSQALVEGGGWQEICSGEVTHGSLSVVRWSPGEGGRVNLFFSRFNRFCPFKLFKSDFMSPLKMSIDTKMPMFSNQIIVSSRSVSFPSNFSRSQLPSDWTFQNWVSDFSLWVQVVCVDRG